MYETEIPPSSGSRLAAERYRRGWSQQDVADSIGTTPLTVSRWERGLMKPGPYFRYKLAALFGISAHALGLMPETPGVVTDRKWVADKSEGTPLHDSAIPLPLTMTPLIGRDREKNYLKQLFFSAKGASFAAIHGLPGVGKTALVLELVHDQEVREHFDGGILWATLGPNANTHEIVSRWGALFNLSGNETIQLTTVDAWVKELKIAIGQRRFLVVLDDVWRIEDAWPCVIGGARSVYVLTTCFPQVSLAFARSRTLPLHELDQEDSLTFVRYLAPEVVEKARVQVENLIQAVGGLPLALALIGNHLRSHSNQPRRIRTTLINLLNTQTRLRLANARLFSDSPRQLSAGPISLEKAITPIYRRLSEPAQRALQALSIFPPKPESFSEEEALTICQIGTDVIDELSDAGLLESNIAGRYMLHPVVADYSRLFHMSTPD